MFTKSCELEIIRSTRAGDAEMPLFRVGQRPKSK